MAETVALSADLIERMRERCGSEWRRTGEGDWSRMPKDLRKKHSDTGGGLVGMMIESFLSHAPQPSGPLKPVEPLPAKAIEKAENALGFALPAQLRQIYAQVGDGGFGPFNGIRRLSNWAKDYQKLRADMLKERGREWPETLLPIVYLNGKRICVDRSSGAVVLWTKPPKKVSEKKWLASFVPQSPSVAEWLERWVDTPTQIEGGPEGGWAPPEEERARREQAIADQEAKKAAELEKARSFTMADHPPLADELLEQVRARAADPARRTYFASTNVAPFGLDDVEDALEKNASVLPPNAMSGLSAMLGGLRKLVSLTNALGMPGFSMVSAPGGGMVMMRSGKGGKLGAPATDASLAYACEKLGFALPVPLQQLYRIADGGFGRGDTGLFSIADMIARYTKLTSKAPGPSGEPWPAKLLPIFEEDDEALGTFDLESGKIIVYDPSRMQDIHGGYFRRSFVTEAESLAELLQRWLSSPTFADDRARQERILERQRQRIAKQVEAGTYKAFSDPVQQAEAEIHYYSFLTPEMRAEDGLPDVGWEDEIRRRNGLI